MVMATTHGFLRSAVTMRGVHELLQPLPLSYLVLPWILVPTGFCQQPPWGEVTFATFSRGVCSWSQWVSLALRPCLNGCKIKKAHVGPPGSAGRSGWSTRSCRCPWLPHGPNPPPLLPSSSSYSLPPLP